MRMTFSASKDARIQAGSPDVNFGGAQLWVNTESSHYSLVAFDLSDLPAGAVIESASLVLHYSGFYDGCREVEVGAVTASWEEATVTWNNRPSVLWDGGPVTTVGDSVGDVQWDVTPAVVAWQSGAQPNQGLALRAEGVGPGKIFHSKELANGKHPPRLIVRYRLDVGSCL